MPAKKLSVPLTPDMEKALNDLCERHAYQLPTLASVLLRDALAGRRSPLLSKRVSAPQNGSEATNGSEPVYDTGRRRNGPWGILGGRKGVNGDA